LDDLQKQAADHRYSGKVTFLVCCMDGPGSAKRSMEAKGLNPSLMHHVDGHPNRDAYEIQYAIAKAVFDATGTCTACTWALDFWHELGRLPL
jgi:hypothetical protein